MEPLSDSWEWIRTNLPSLASLIFAGVVAGAAVVSAMLNRSLVKETIALRKAETDPFVAVYIEQNEAGFSFFDLVIKNIGRGAAFKVKFTVSPDVPIWHDDEYRLTDAAVISDGLDFLAPGQDLRFFYGSYIELTKEPITIGVQYSGVDSKGRHLPFENDFTLRVEKYAGMTQVGEPPLATISNSLDTISKDFSAIKSGQTEVKVSVSRQYFFSRYMRRRWRNLFGSKNFSNSHTSIRDLIAAFRTQRSSRRRR